MTIQLAQVGALISSVSTWNPSSMTEDGTFPYIDLSSVDNETKQIRATQEVRFKDAPSRARQLVRSGDILVSTVRPNLNGVAKVDKACNRTTASTGFCVLRANRDVVDPAYLFQWVKSPSFVSDMVRKATGASYPAVSDRIIAESLVPLPPLDEQRRIAKILDQADSLRRERINGLQQLDDLVPALFNELFGDPLANPHGFRRAILEEIVDMARPITYGIVLPGPHVEEGIPYVRVIDIQEGGIATAGLRKTSEAIAAQYTRSKLKCDDLLISIRGHVGRLGVVPKSLEGANLTQDTARIAVSSAATLFVKSLLETPQAKNWMDRHTKGAAVKGLNLGDLRKLPIILPPLNLQHTFAARVAEIDRLKVLRCHDRR